MRKIAFSMVASSFALVINHGSMAEELSEPSISENDPTDGPLLEFHYYLNNDGESEQPSQDEQRRAFLQAGKNFVHGCPIEPAHPVNIEPEVAADFAAKSQRTPKLTAESALRTYHTSLYFCVAKRQQKLGDGALSYEQAGALIEEGKFMHALIMQKIVDYRRMLEAESKNASAQLTLAANMLDLASMGNSEKAIEILKAKDSCLRGYLDTIKIKYQTLSKYNFKQAGKLKDENKPQLLNCYRDIANQFDLYGTW